MATRNHSTSPSSGSPAYRKGNCGPTAQTLWSFRNPLPAVRPLNPAADPLTLSSIVRVGGRDCSCSKAVRDRLAFPIRTRAVRASTFIHRISSAGLPGETVVRSERASRAVSSNPRHLGRARTKLAAIQFSSQRRGKQTREHDFRVAPGMDLWDRMKRWPVRRGSRSSARPAKPSLGRAA